MLSASKSSPEVRPMSRVSKASALCSMSTAPAAKRRKRSSTASAGGAPARLALVIPWSRRA